MFQNQSLHPPDTQSMISGAGSKGCAKVSVYMIQIRDSLILDQLAVDFFPRFSHFIQIPDNN